MEKNPKLINVGPTFIPDYRVVDWSTTLDITVTQKLNFCVFWISKTHLTFFSCLSDSANLFTKISLTRIEAAVVRQKMGQSDLQQFFATNTNSHSFSTLAP